MATHSSLASHWRLLPAALGSNLLIGVAPWQQAQPRAQEPCLCYLRGWMQPEEEKKNIACPPAGLEDDFVFRFMCFCSAAIEDLKLHTPGKRLFRDAISN